MFSTYVLGLLYFTVENEEWGVVVFQEVGTVESIRVSEFIEVKNNARSQELPYYPSDNSKSVFIVTLSSYYHGLDIWLIGTHLFNYRITKLQNKKGTVTLSITISAIIYCGLHVS